METHCFHSPQIAHGKSGIVLESFPLFSVLTIQYYKRKLILQNNFCEWIKILLKRAKKPFRAPNTSLIRYKQQLL